MLGRTLSTAVWTGNEYSTQTKHLYILSVSILQYMCVPYPTNNTSSCNTAAAATTASHIYCIIKSSTVIVHILTTVAFTLSQLYIHVDQQMASPGEIYRHTHTNRWGTRLCMCVGPIYTKHLHILDYYERHTHTYSKSTCRCTFNWLSYFILSTHTWQIKHHFLQNTCTAASSKEIEQTVL